MLLVSVFISDTMNWIFIGIQWMFISVQIVGLYHQKQKNKKIDKKIDNELNEWKQKLRDSIK